MGGQKLASSYLVKITLGKEPNQLTFQTKTFPVDLSRREVWADEDTIGIQEGCIRRMLTENEDVHSKAKSPLLLIAKYEITKQS